MEGLGGAVISDGGRIPSDVDLGKGAAVQAGPAGRPNLILAWLHIQHPAYQIHQHLRKFFKMPLPPPSKTMLLSREEIPSPLLYIFMCVYSMRQGPLPDSSLHTLFSTHSHGRMCILLLLMDAD